MSNNPSSNGSSNGSMSGVNALASMSSIFASAKDTFNKNGGNTILSSVSSSIPQGTKDYIYSAKSKIFNRGQLRSISIFFGIGEEKPFYVEKVPSLIIERIRHNIFFFYMNYIFLTTVLFCLTLIISPSAIIGIGLLGFAWLGFIRATSEGSLTLGPITIQQKQASIGMTALSGIVLFYLLRHIFWWTVGSSGCLVGIHAFLRDASLHKDAEDKIEMRGDIGSGVVGEVDEEAAFLGSNTLV